MVSGPISRPIQPSGISLEGTILASASAANCVGDDGVVGQQQLDALGGCFLEQGFGQVDLVGFAQRGADAVALGSEEGVGHAAADDQGVDLGDQVVDDADLVGDLGAAEDGDERAFRVQPGLRP